MAGVHPEMRRVVEAMRRREREWRWWAVGELALGVAMTAGLPLVLAGIGEWEWDRMQGEHFWVVVAILGALMTVAYGAEWRYRGGNLSQRLREAGGGGGMWESMDSRYWRYAQVEAALQWEVWLFVPRTVFEGWGKLRMMQMVGGIERGTAAATFRKVLERDRQVVVESLKREGDDLGLGRQMAYLVFYEWVAASEDGKRVWAGTEVRRELGR
jgi:hypothetical protein